MDRTPFLCRIGIHLHVYNDASLCHSAERCGRCHAWVDRVGGAYVNACREMTAAGTHPDRPGPCFLSDSM